MIKNIVFDIGNVLADFRIMEFLTEKGLDVPTIKRVIKASVMNPYWGKFERGEVTEEETLQAFAAADEYGLPSGWPQREPVRRSRAAAGSAGNADKTDPSELIVWVRSA